MKISREFQSEAASLFFDTLSQEPIFTSFVFLEDGNREKKTYMLVLPKAVWRNTFQNL